MLPESSVLSLSVVIPCYNESKNLPALLERLDLLSKKIAKLEVVLVDNGSTDDTQSVLDELISSRQWCRSIRVEVNQGYGYGIIAGLNVAQGDILSWTHADIQTDPCDLAAGFEYFVNNGSNIFVKGRRYGRPFGDVFFTIGMSVFESFLLRKPMWDINAQPTMFSKLFFQSWVAPPHDFALDLYAYYKAKASSVKVFRFPVLFGERAHGTSHWNIDMSSKIKFIKRTMQYSFKLSKNI